MLLDVIDHGAQVVRPFRLVRDLPSGRATTNAKALALSALWVARRADGADFWTWLRSKEGSAAFDTASALAQNGGSAAVRAILGTRGFSSLGSSVTFSSAGALAEGALAHDGNYHVLVVEGAAGGHAMAIRRENGVLLFDPHLGEVVFPAAGNFRQFLPDALLAHGSGDAGRDLLRIDRFELTSFSARVVVA